MFRLFNKRSRNLTSGEIDILKPIFRDSIDYYAVKIYKNRYIPFQNKNMALSPNGNIYFDSKHYQDDFSISSNADKMWFVHEMTHVWQYQNGFSILKNAIKLSLQGLYKNKKVYYYDHKCAEEHFCRFNFEQQATIIEHYFGAKYLKVGKYADKLPYFENILDGFLKNPKDKTLLSSS